MEPGDYKARNASKSVMQLLMGNAGPAGVPARSPLAHGSSAGKQLGRASNHQRRDWAAPTTDQSG
jgi:hypothetical protein